MARYQLKLPRVNEVSVVYSPRLTRSLSRCYPSRREIRLHQRLKQALPRLKQEVLVHELAHIAVFERYGDSVRPHGPEWQALVRQAGFEPQTRFTIDDLKRSKSCAKLLYDHRCPICGMVRTAKRPVRRWRCATCVEAGLEGLLEMTTRPSRPKGGSP